VKYAQGELKVIACKNGREWTVDSTKTTGLAASLELSCDRTEIDADGRDLSFVTVKIVNKDGLVLPTEGNLVCFKVGGPGIIAAVENGNPADHGSFRSDRSKAFHGQCLQIVRSIEGNHGQIRLTAESEALRTGNIVIRSK
jgi:beta-galactosidase